MATPAAECLISFNVGTGTLWSEGRCHENIICPFYNKEDKRFVAPNFFL